MPDGPLEVNMFGGVPDDGSGALEAAEQLIQQVAESTGLGARLQLGARNVTVYIINSSGTTLHLPAEGRSLVEGIQMGDKYEVSGQAGIVAGSGANVHHVDQSLLWKQVQHEISLPALGEELARLLIKLQQYAKTDDQVIAVGEIAAAKKAANANDGPTVLQHLKNAGEWALEVAREIGVEVAASALQRAMGM